MNIKTCYRTNINHICSNLRVGFKNPKPKWERSQIIRKGIKLEDGSMLWQDYATGRLYIEKSHNK